MSNVTEILDALTVYVDSNEAEDLQLDMRNLFNTLHPKYKYIAVDRDMCTFAFIHKPSRRTMGWSTERSADYCCLNVCIDNYKQVDWKNSLIARPEGETYTPFHYMKTMLNSTTIPGHHVDKEV